MISDIAATLMRAPNCAWRLMMAGGFLALCAAIPHPARAEMWKCVDQDGSTRYTNVKADAKGCKSLGIEPERPPAGSGKAQATTARNANFPSVDSNTQKQRDVERRKLLDRELGDEMRGLEVAKKELADQKAKRTTVSTGPADAALKPYEDRVRRHEVNIDSLKKELANIK